MTSIKYPINISLIFFLLIILFPLLAFSENKFLTQEKIEKNSFFIKKASSIASINYTYLSAIIYTERTLNYNWVDEKFDTYFAKIGKNSSIGFCQIKLKTAYYIEKQVNDINSKYFIGQNFQKNITISKSPDELLHKLTDDYTNILYASAYIKMIQKRWKKAGYSIDDRPDILGTLYSTGLYYHDGSERKPHSDPKSNIFGKKVLQTINNLAR